METALLGVCGALGSSHTRRFVSQGVRIVFLSCSSFRILQGDNYRGVIYHFEGSAHLPLSVVFIFYFFKARLLNIFFLLPPLVFSPSPGGFSPLFLSSQEKRAREVGSAQARQTTHTLSSGLIFGEPCPSVPKKSPSTVESCTVLCTCAVRVVACRRGTNKPRCTCLSFQKTKQLAQAALCFEF